MPIALTGHRAVAVGPDIYVVGGFKGANGIRQGFGGVPFVWRYRPPLRQLDVPRERRCD